MAVDYNYDYEYQAPITRGTNANGAASMAVALNGQIAVCNQTSGTVSFFSKNPTTGIYDTSSTLLALTGFSGNRGITYCATSDQFAVANNTTNVVTIISKNGATGVFDSGSPTVNITVPGTSPQPASICWIPTTNQLAVGNSSANTVTIITPSGSSSFNASATTATISLPANSQPRAICHIPSTDQIAVANLNTGTVSFISKVGGTFSASSAVSTLSLGSTTSPRGVCHITSTNQVAVALYGTNNLAFIDPASGVFSSSSGFITRAVGVNPQWVTYVSLTDQVVTPNTGSNTVTFVSKDLTTGKFTTNSYASTRGVGAGPICCLETPDTGQVTVTNFNAATSANISHIALNLVNVLLTPSATITARVQESFSSPSDAIYFSGTSIQINSATSFFLFDARSGLAALLGYANYSRQENTQVTVGDTLIFSGASAALSGDFTITMGAGTITRLGTRSTYTEKLIVPSTGVIEVRGDVNISAFTLAPGVTINRASGVTSPCTVTIGQNVAVTAGTGVTVVKPLILLTAPNLPNGTHYLIRYADGDKAELAIGTVSGSSGLTFTLPAANNRLIELLAVNVTSAPLYASELFKFTFRNIGVSVSAEEALTEYPYYAQFALDGLSTGITNKFAFDNPNLQVDASELDGVLSAKEIHAFVWGQMQVNDAALRLGYVPLEAFTAVGYIVRSGWKVENQSTTTPLLITDGYYLDENSNFYNPCASATGGKQSASVFFEPSHTLTIESTGSQIQVPMLR